jgi:hypothetical protein
VRESKYLYCVHVTFAIMVHGMCVVLVFVCVEYECVGVS